MNNEQNSYINKVEQGATRYKPVARVSFHTEDKCYKVKGISKGAEASQDPTDQLLSINTVKLMDSPAGTFSVTLQGAWWFENNGKKVLKSNDLVIIEMGYMAEDKVVTWLDGTTHTSEVDMDTVMVGLVDTVTRTRNGGGSGMSPNVQVTVTGRDFGKLLIKAMLKFYPQLGAGGDDNKFFLTETGWLALTRVFTNENAIKGSPAKIIDNILRFILKKILVMKWKVYDQSDTSYKVVDFTSIIRYKLAETNFFIPFYMTAQDYEGSVWNLMSKVNLQPFTEMFIDTRDKWDVANSDGIAMSVNETVEEDSSEAKGKLTDEAGKWAYPAVTFGESDGGQVLLTYRNTPFDKASWNKLRTHEVEEKDVTQESLSYSDNENYNLFWAGSTLTPFNDLNLKAVSPPLINKDNVTRYGLQPLEVTVEGLELDKSQESSQKIALAGLSSTLNTKLKDWFEKNSEYLSGNLTMRGRGDIKIGRRLHYKEMDKYFYIEGVTQNFEVYGNWETQVTLTRGQDPLPPDPPPPATPTPSQAPVEEKYYTVKRGDTLWAIAKVKYGNPQKWTTIWEANKTMLIKRDKRNAKDHGHWIYPGMKLIIP